MSQTINKRDELMNRIEKANEKYLESLRYLSPELIPAIGRNPAKVVKKMVECIPEDNNEMAENLISILEFALQRDITDLTVHFWQPISDSILGKIVGDVNSQWKQKVVLYWMGQIPLDN